MFASWSSYTVTYNFIGCFKTLGWYSEGVLDMEEAGAVWGMWSELMQALAETKLHGRLCLSFKVAGKAY